MAKAERRVLHFEMEDVEALRARVLRADVVSAEVFERAYARAGNRGRNIDLHGIEPNLRQLREVAMATGRFLSAEDLRLRRHVVVLGHIARERLFGVRPALGQALLLHGQAFAVVGSLRRVGAPLSRNRSEVDEQLWIPITMAMTLAGRESVDLIQFRIKERRFNENAKRDTRAILAERLHVSPHDEEAVFLISTIDMLATFDSVFAFVQVFLIVLAAGTLLIGVVFRAGIIRGLSMLRAASGNSDLLVPSIQLSPELALLAFAGLVAVGVLAGIVPAQRAARLDPAVALRLE